jgi:hypothetical protein
VEVKEIAGKLVCTAFAISSSIRGDGRDSFISMSFGDLQVPLTDISKHIFVAEKYLSQMALVDAAAKGIITVEVADRLGKSQKENYDKLLNRMVKES